MSNRIHQTRGLDLVPIREKSEWGPHPFVRELCRGACPYGAGLGGSYRKLPDGKYCLRPKHYQELTTAVKEAAQKAAAKERDRLKTTAVKSAAVAIDGPAAGIRPAGAGARAAPPAAPRGPGASSRWRSVGTYPRGRPEA